MLHIAICDNSGEDSQETRRLVEQALGGYTVRYNIQVFESGEELLVSSVLFDLIFMEAALEGEDGIEIGKKLYCRNRATKIIFQSYSIDSQEIISRYYTKIADYHHYIQRKKSR